MASNAAAIAEEYIAQMTPEQHLKFEQYWGEFSKDQNVVSRLLEGSGALDEWKAVHKQLRDNINDIVRRSGIFDKINDRVAELATSLPSFAFELPQDVTDNIQRLAGFEAQFADAVTIGQYGAALLQDPDAAEFRTAVEIKLGEKRDLLAEIHKVTVSEAIYKVVPPEAIQFGLKAIIFLIWFSIALYIAGGVYVAALILQGLGADLNIVTGIKFANTAGEWIYPLPPVEDGSQD